MKFKVFRCIRTIALALGLLLLASALFGCAQPDPTSPTPPPSESDPAAPTQPPNEASPESNPASLLREGDRVSDGISDPSPIATARIRAVGDIIIDAPMIDAAYAKGSYKFGKYFAKIAPQLQDADLTVANIEGALCGQGDLGYTGYPSFNTPPSILKALKSAGVDMLTMANNHALDRYFQGLVQSVKNVDKAGLLRVGAYKSKKDFNTPKVVDINGIQVGFTNYTTGTNGVQERSDKRALQFGLRTVERANYKKDIQALRDAGAQIVIVFMHWDREYKHNPSEATREIAKKLAAAGADAIIGGHAHMVQPIEYVTATDEQGNERQALVVFSMGNFLSNHEGEYLDNGILVEITLARYSDGSVRVIDPRYMPVWVWVQKGDGSVNYQVMPAGQAIDSRPEGMTDKQYERACAAWEESRQVVGDVAQAMRQ